MRVLIVEDQESKELSLKRFLIDEYNTTDLITEKSLKGALKRLVSDKNFNVILLDMSMPNFDPSFSNPADSSPESFAGRELMQQMRLRGIKIPVIVVTQYSRFQGGALSLDDLSAGFSNDFPEFYLGSVYYDASVESWKNNLKAFLEKSQ
jgi:CheY-like chemotaxis protein